MYLPRIIGGRYSRNQLGKNVCLFSITFSRNVPVSSRSLTQLHGSTVVRRRFIAQVRVSASLSPRALGFGARRKIFKHFSFLHDEYDAPNDSGFHLPSRL